MSKKSDEIDTVLAIVSEDGWQLENFPDHQDNKKVVLAAVQNVGAALQFASHNLKSDKDVVLAAVKNDPYVLDFADEKFRDDDDIMDACAAQDE